MLIRNLLIRREAALWEVVDPDDVYYLEARDDDTLVRRRDADPLHDIRSLGELTAALEGHGFFRIHRSFAVNLERVRQVRKRDDGRDWEVKMDPPVNRVLPVGRDTVSALLSALAGPAASEG